MTQAGMQSPSELVTLIGSGLHVLEEHAIDPADFFRQILCNSLFRDELIDLVRARRYYKVGDNLDESLLGDFIFTVFTDKVTAEEFDALMQRYNNPAALRELMKDLTPLEISLLVMHYGLDDSSPEPLERVAEHHSMVPAITVGTIDHAEYKLRRTRIDQVLGK